MPSRPGPGSLVLWTVTCALLLAVVPAVGGDLEAGAAKVKITPPTPFWMSGYAARTHPSEGVLQDLWARALAVRDAEGNRVVLVSTDLIGLSRVISADVVVRAGKRFGLEPSEIVLPPIAITPGDGYIAVSGLAVGAQIGLIGRAIRLYSSRNTLSGDYTGSSSTNGDEFYPAPPAYDGSLTLTKIGNDY